MVDKCAHPPPRHRGASLLIINTDLTQRRDQRIKRVSGLTISQMLLLMDLDAGVFAWCTGVESIFLVICSRYQPSVAVEAPGCPLVITVRKQGRFSQMTLPPPSPSSLIPTFRPVSISCPPPASPEARWGDASRTGEDKLQPQSLGYLPCFICTSN